MNFIKSLFIASMSLGLVGTASVARAEQPVEEGVVAEAEGALMVEEATEERNISESDEALSSQDWDPYDYEGYRRRGGRHGCLAFCRSEYFECERFGGERDRWRRRGFHRDHRSRHDRCESEYLFCEQRVCRRGHRGGRFDR